MIQIIKLTIAFVLAFFIYNFLVDSFKVPKPKQKVVVNTIEKKKKSIFESPTPPPRKEVIFHLEEGQELKENQVLYDTPEGEEQFKKNVAWLSDICDNYARKQWEIHNKEIERVKKQGENISKLDGKEVRRATLP